MVRAWAATVRAAASKIRWLAVVVAWFSMTRALARVSTSWLKVTWAWPPGEVSQRRAGSAARAWAGAAAGVRGAGAVVWWVVRPQPARRAMVASAPARLVSFMSSSGVAAALWLVGSACVAGVAAPFAGQLQAGSSANDCQSVRHGSGSRRKRINPEEARVHRGSARPWTTPDLLASLAGRVICLVHVGT